MAKKYTLPQNTQALVKAGLTPGQAAMYEALIQHGRLNARRASFLADVPRTLGYKILAELEGLGLVVKNDKPGSVADFTPSHPQKLKELGERRFEEAKEAKKAADDAFINLSAELTASFGSLYILKPAQNADFAKLSALLKGHGELIAPDATIQAKLAALII